MTESPILSTKFTARSTVLLEKLTGSQLVKKFPAFYGNRRFITAFTSAHHLSLSWASSIQSIPPHPNSWRSILILSSHQRLVFPSCLLPSGFPTKTLYMSLLSPIRATCPAHLILLDSTKNTYTDIFHRPIFAANSVSEPSSAIMIRQKYETYPYSVVPIRWSSSVSTD